MCTFGNCENSSCNTTILANEVWVNPSKQTILVGTWYEYAIADVYPSNATNKNVVWTSSNEKVATVNPSSGRIYGVSEGCATIYATAADGSGCRDCLALTVVTEIKAEYISLSLNKIALEKGGSKKICACICPINATNQDVIWSSNNESVATVDCNGTVYGHAAGTAVITATVADGSGKSASCTATVTDDILVTSISVGLQNKTPTVGDTAYMRVTVCPSNATNKNVRWCSSDPSIASVSTYDGELWARSEGSVTIYAIAEDGSNVTGCLDIYVIPYVNVDSVSVWPQSLTLCVGDTRCLTPIICPNDATDKSVTWTSSDDNIATIGTHTGIVRAISPGSTSIVVTSSNGKLHGYCEITVDERKKARIEREYSFSDKFIIHFPENYPNHLKWYSIQEIVTQSDIDNSTSLGKRFTNNRSNEFSIQQLAFIYRFDPLGVEQYVKLKYLNHTDDSDAQTIEKLTYKDKLFNEIYGVMPSLFLPDSAQKNHIEYSSGLSIYSREFWISEAEILFGAHTPKDPDTLIETLVDIALLLADITIEIFCPSNKLLSEIVNILENIDEYQALFFSGSFTDYFSTGASKFLEKYIEDGGDRDAKNLFKWYSGLFDILYSIADLFSPPNLNDISIYNKIKDSNSYRACFLVNGSEIYIDEIIELSQTCC